MHLYCAPNRAFISGMVLALTTKIKVWIAMTAGSKSTLFIGPKGEQGQVFSSLWDHLLSVTMNRRSQRFANDCEWHPLSTTVHHGDQATVLSALEELLDLLREEIPTFSPRYLGHMVSDVSIPALLGHMAMLFENANLA